MGEQRKILVEHLTVNYEKDGHYLIVVEVVDDTIVATYTVKIPKAFMDRNRARGCQMFPN